MIKTVRYVSEGDIGRVQFNRPHAMNGLDGQLPIDLCTAWDEAKSDVQSRVIIFEGNGNCFMAGGDLHYFKQLIDAQSSPEDEVVPLSFFEHINGAISKMRALPKPIIAKVHGAVAGIGLSYMLGADLIIADERTIFTMAYNNIGITPDGGCTKLLAERIGFGRAMEMALLNDKLDAHTAQTIGLVNFVSHSGEENQLEADTLALAERLICAPRTALANTKHLFNQSLYNTLEQQLTLEAELFTQGSKGVEFAEGVNAFIEKRRADFSEAKQ